MLESYTRIIINHVELSSNRYRITIVIYALWVTQRALPMHALIKTRLFSYCHCTETIACAKEQYTLIVGAFRGQCVVCAVLSIHNTAKQLKTQKESYPCEPLRRHRLFVCLFRLVAPCNPRSSLQSNKYSLFHFDSLCFRARGCYTTIRLSQRTARECKVQCKQTFLQLITSSFGNQDTVQWRQYIGCCHCRRCCKSSCLSYRQICDHFKSRATPQLFVWSNVL